MRKEDMLVQALALAVGLTMTGCQKEEPKSPDDIESTQGTFAASYADRITRTSKAIHSREAKAKEDIGTMPTFSEQLGDDAPPDKVLAIVTAADAAGRDEGYGEEARKMSIVQDFFDEEKDPFTKKVGNAAQWAASQKGCKDVDLWGPVSQGVKDGFDDRIKDRMHKRNDAFLLIDHDRDALGKKNVTLLEDESDKISEASYIVHVELPDKKKRLDFAILQIPKQKAALGDLIKNEKDRQTKEKLKPEDQKTSEAHVKDWEQSLASFDAAEKDAKDNQQDIDGRIEALGKDYAAGFSAMKEAIKSGKKK